MSVTTENPRVNGVDTAKLFGTLDVVKEQPQIAEFQFRAANTWLSGTHSRTSYDGFFGATQELRHKQVTVVDADHPEVLTGADHAPTPVEYLLHALAACITAGIGNVAAARGVNLTSVTSTVAGDIDLMGLLGLDPTVRNGYQSIEMKVRIEGDAEAEVLRKVVERSIARSAVFDMLTNGTTVTVTVE